MASYSGAREGPWSRRTYPLIVLLHTAVIGGTLALGGKVRLPWLAAFLALQPIRFWVLWTLGDRWNTRAVVPEGLVVATEGPYAFVRHPNYAIVAGELAALPAAFGLGRLAAAATAINAVLLTLRIREEEALLLAAESYREHFADKPRFLPGLF
ncbi:MAG TPA: isoprenylcysteine carboxylmethyltransferase family protein [Dehalococcoidia bacterium]|nr:isoprenylcysteine carboxylmethyltransferase family protein [Dehalococcoidia bacterium]